MTTDFPASTRGAGSDSAKSRILRKANDIYFSHRNDEECKTRITHKQAEAIIEAWIREVMPWWFDEE